MVSHADGTIIVYDKDREDPTGPVAKGSDLDSEASAEAMLNEWEPLEKMLVTPGMPGMNGSGGDKGPKGKTLNNPVSHWRVSRKAIQCESELL